MNAKDVKCPICGTVNRSLDLDETDGWMDGWNVNASMEYMGELKRSTP